MAAAFCGFLLTPDVFVVGKVSILKNLWVPPLTPPTGASVGVASLAPARSALGTRVVRAQIQHYAIL